jgi:hypothetical protein
MIKLNNNNKTKILVSGSVNNRTNFKSTNQPVVEDDYISNLQKQIYYLELEMKLMKDREVETKNKIGGYGEKNYFIKIKNFI